MKIIRNILNKLFTKNKHVVCEHGFEIHEVMNLKIDPICKKCGKSLNEINNKYINYG